MYAVKTNTTQIPWSAENSGLSMKVLHQDESSGAMTAMTRLAPNSFIPAHSHTHADQTVYVLEGDLIDDAVTYGPGSFFVAKAGAPHGPHTTSTGCILLTTYNARPDFVPVA